MKPIGDGSIIKYTQGKCMRFAVALWIEHGKQHNIAIFNRADSHYMHACLEIARGRYLDVNGLHRGTRKTARSFGFTDVELVDPRADRWTQNLLRRKEFKEDVRKAQWLIRRHRARYLLTG
jgi:hypothetical protein